MYGIPAGPGLPGLPGTYGVPEVPGVYVVCVVHTVLGGGVKVRFQVVEWYRYICDGILVSMIGLIGIIGDATSHKSNHSKLNFCRKYLCSPGPAKTEAEGLFSSGKLWPLKC